MTKVVTVPDSGVNLVTECAAFNFTPAKMRCQVTVRLEALAGQFRQNAAQILEGRQEIRSHPEEVYVSSSEFDADGFRKSAGWQETSKYTVKIGALWKRYGHFHGRGAYSR